VASDAGNSSVSPDAVAHFEEFHLIEELGVTPGLVLTQEGVCMEGRSLEVVRHGNCGIERVSLVD
jgi:hypothetical protein